MNTLSSLIRSIRLSSSASPRDAKKMLLAAAAAVALTAGTAAKASPNPMPTVAGVNTGTVSPPCAVGICWWDQNNGSDGNAIDSQNFTSGVLTSLNDAAADDFLVPQLSGRTVHAVDVSGIYFSGTGPASSVNVTFYKNAAGNHPGIIKAQFIGIPYFDPTGTGSFQIQLCNWNVPHTACKPTKVAFNGGNGLNPKRFWVSVVANCNFYGGCGEWGWGTRAVVTGTSPAMWQNPSNGFVTGCTTWTAAYSCVGLSTTEDFMFDLR